MEGWQGQATILGFPFLDASKWGESSEWGEGRLRQEHVPAGSQESRGTTMNDDWASAHP